MRFAAVMVLTLIVISSLAAFSDPLSVDGGEGNAVSINLPYCAPRINASTRNPAMVGGVYHNLSVNVGHAFSSVNVSLSRGGTAFYYLYSEGNWTAPVGNESLLDIGHCYAGTTAALFVMGVPLGSSIGNWTLSVDVDGSPFYSGFITVEVPYAHFSMSTPDFVFRVDPFTNEVLYPTVDTYKVRLVNPGNVPLEIHPDFESFDNMFSITNATGIFIPLEQRELHLSFTVPSWSPRIIKTHVSVVGTPLFIIPSKPGTANINSSYKQTFDVEIDVVRQGYELLDLGNVTVQYKKTLYADYNTDIGLDLFFTGVKDITLDVSTESIRLDKITLENATVSAPVSLSLTNTSERHMHLSLNTSSPQITAFVEYHLETTDSTVSRNFHTEIVVGPRPIKPFNSSFYINTIGISLFLIFLIVLVGYAGLLYRRHKKEEGEKTDEESEKAIRRARKGAEKRVKVKRYKSRPSPRGKARTGTENRKPRKR